MSEGGGGSAAGTARSVVSYSGGVKGDLLYADALQTVAFAVTFDSDTLETFVQTCMSLVGLAEADGLVHNVEVHPIIPMWLAKIPELTMKRMSEKLRIEYGVNRIGAYKHFEEMFAWIVDKCNTSFKEDIAKNGNAVSTVWHYIIPLSATLKTETDAPDDLNYTFDHGGLLDPTVNLYQKSTFQNSQHCYAFNETTDMLALHSVRILLAKTNTRTFDDHKGAYNFDHNCPADDTLQLRLEALKTATGNNDPNNQFLNKLVYLQITEDRNTLLKLPDDRANMYFKDTYHYAIVPSMPYDLPAQHEYAFPTADIVNKTTKAMGSHPNLPRAPLVYASMAKIQKMPTNQYLPYYMQFRSIPAVVADFRIDDGAGALPTLQCIFFKTSVAGSDELLTLLETQLKEIVPFVRQLHCSRSNTRLARCTKGEATGHTLKFEQDITAEFVHDGKMRGLVYSASASNKTSVDEFIKQSREEPLTCSLSANAPAMQGKILESYNVLQQLMVLRFSNGGMLKYAQGQNIVLNDALEDRYTILAKHQLWIDMKLFMLIATFKSIHDTHKLMWAQLQMEVLIKIHALLQKNVNDTYTATTSHSYLLQDILSKCDEMMYYGILGNKKNPTWCASPEIDMGRELGNFFTEYSEQLMAFSKAQCSTHVVDNFEEGLFNSMLKSVNDNMVVEYDTFTRADKLQSVWCVTFDEKNMASCSFEREQLQCYVVERQNVSVETSVKAVLDKGAVPNVFTQGRVMARDTLSQKVCKYRTPKSVAALSERGTIQLVMQFPGTCKTGDGTTDTGGYMYMRALLDELEFDGNQPHLLAPFTNARLFCQHIAASQIDAGALSPQNCAVVPYQWNTTNGTQTLIPAENDESIVDKRVIPLYVQNLFLKDATFQKHFRRWWRQKKGQWNDAAYFTQGNAWLNYAVGMLDKVKKEANYKDVTETKMQQFWETAADQMLAPPEHFVAAEGGYWHHAVGYIFIAMLHDDAYEAILRGEFRDNFVSMDESADDPATGFEAAFTDSSFLDYTRSCMSDAVHAELPPTALLGFSARFNREMEPHVVSELLDREHPLRSLTSGAFCAKVFSDFPTLSARARHEWEPWVAAQHAAALAM